MTGSTSVRLPAVAGQFYPADASALATLVDDLLSDARPPAVAPPVAVVAPHAGYVYSGPIAASAYATVRATGAELRHVLLLGPAHRAPLDGIALPSVDAFRTPLGDVAVDAELRELVRPLPAVVTDDRAHAGEHALEVHLPFLQRVAAAAAVLPMVVGHCRTADVARVIETCRRVPGTLVVVSTDLSHYEPYASAAVHDRATADAIVATCADDIGPYDACGVYPLRGLLAVARTEGLHVVPLDLRSSGDTAGSHDRVVGYGAFALVGPSQ